MAGRQFDKLGWYGLSNSLTEVSLVIQGSSKIQGLYIKDLLLKSHIEDHWYRLTDSRI